jgi:hypothetical protein
MGAAIADLLNISSARLVDLFFVLVGFELAPYFALRWALRAPGIVLWMQCQTFFLGWHRPTHLSQASESPLNLMSLSRIVFMFPECGMPKLLHHSCNLDLVTAGP